MMTPQQMLNIYSEMGSAVRQSLQDITLTGIQDTPSGYQGHSGDYLVVNDNESGIHFTGIEKIAADLTDYGFGGGGGSSTIPSYTDLPDVTENDGKIVASGCDLYHSCNGTWNKIGGESIPPPEEAPACVTNLEEHNQYQEYKDEFLADNLGNTFDQMLNSNNDISNLILNVCLFPESNLEDERNTVVIDETTYKWGMFAGPQTINLSAEGYSDGQGKDCVFSEWTSSNANFGDSSSANTTVFVDTDLSITGSFECLIAPSQPSCDRVVLHLQPAAGETIADKSSDEHAITTVGDTVVDNTATLFGGGTMNFDGNGDYLSIGDTSTFKFLHDGTTDYTVECWLQVSNLLNNAPSPSRIMSTARNSTDSGIDFFVTANGLLGYWIYGGQNQQYYKTITLGSNSALQSNTWYHIVLKNTVTQELKIYINGVEQVGQTATIDPQKVSTLDATSMLLVGQIVGLDRPLNGQLQDLRISKKAVYTSNFTPPTNLLNNPC